MQHATRMRCFRSTLLYLSLFLALPLQAQNVLPPSAADGYVTDRAGLLSGSEEQALEQKLAAYDRESSTQIVVVILRTLGGAAIDQYAVELGQSWGVGQKGQDNGMVVLVAIEDRRVFIATGYGVEGSVPDIVAGQIIRETITPQFRRGNYFRGLALATDALIETTRGEFQAQPRRSLSEDTGIDMATLLILMIIIFFIIQGLRNGDDDGDMPTGGRRYRRRHYNGGPVIIWGGGSGGGWGGGGGFGGGFGGGGFGGFGGGGFGGGGAGGGW